MANKHIAARFGKLLAASGLTDRTAAAILHCHHGTIGNFRNAVREVPSEILDWLERVVTVVSKAPDYRELRPPAGRPSKGNES